MLLHLVPKIVNRYRDITVSLVDVSIPELNLHLRNNIDVVVRKPYPNKTHHVVCRKKGLKAIDGIFVLTNKQLSNFSVVTRWRVEESGKVLEHVVNYTLLDNEYDCLSDDPISWMSTNDGVFTNRTPTHLESYTPLESRVAMEVLFTGNQSFKKCFFDDAFEGNMLIKRVENSSLHTIKRERLLHWQRKTDRMPSIVDAFTVTLPEQLSA